MKQFNLIIGFLLFVFGGSFAQNTVNLNIRHLLEGEDFAFETAAQNNLGHNFSLSRVEYYISEISILHDGGQETAVENIWLLVNAEEEVNAELGMFEVESVEGVRFHIGVDSAHNHLDPASYPMTHPLAPTFPSMHWGWAAGYRFVALEGHCGAGLNQAVGLHGLGNRNYFEAVVMLEATVEDGVVDINLEADYAYSLQDIDISSGLIVHGSEGEASVLVENFANYVFSAAQSTTAVSAIERSAGLKLYPNPSSMGTVMLEMESGQQTKVQIDVYNQLGQMVARHLWAGTHQPYVLDQLEPGSYWIRLSDQDGLIMSKQLVVTP